MAIPRLDHSLGMGPSVLYSTAILGVSIDRAQHPMRARNNENARVTITVDLRRRVRLPFRIHMLKTRLFQYEVTFTPLEPPNSI